LYKSLYTLSNSIKYIYLIFILILFTSCFQEKSSKETLEIFAAASTQEILEEINFSFSKQNNINIEMNLGGSNNLTTTIIRGATPDIIISAGELPIENIANNGLIARENIIPLWSNSLVIIHHNNNKDKIISIKSILLNSKRIGIADPNLAPAGYYAKEALNQLVDIKEIENKLVYGTNVRTTLAHFATKHVDTALVYNSDVITFSPKESTIILPIPKSLTPSIIYSTGILESSPRKNIANKYITYLKNNSLEILETKGFTPIKSTIQ